MRQQIEVKLVAVIEEPALTEKILKHIGLDPQPPPLAKNAVGGIVWRGLILSIGQRYRGRGGGGGGCANARWRTPG